MKLVRVSILGVIMFLWSCYLGRCRAADWISINDPAATATAELNFVADGAWNAPGTSWSFLYVEHVPNSDGRFLYEWIDDVDPLFPGAPVGTWVAPVTLPVVPAGPIKITVDVYDAQGGFLASTSKTVWCTGQ